VLVIDENEIELTLSDERLEQAIRQTGAKVIVLDPIHAYLGGDVDMHRANEIRPIMKRLALLAERTDCAVILIGHMNKMGGAKSAYRGLGSIDIRAAVRSVLVVGRVKDEPTLRIVAHDKSNLAPRENPLPLSLTPIQVCVERLLRNHSG
jgi:RecA-family ATPase